MKLLRLILTISFFTTVSNANATSPYWEWAHQAAVADTGYPNSICTDAFGNVYVAGVFISPTFTLGNYTLTKTGHATIFYVKYNSTGDVIWAKSSSVSAYRSSHVTSVFCDNAGNIYMTGQFQYEITIGSQNLIGGPQNGFLTKLDSAGNTLWLKQIGTGNNYLTKSCTDATGNIYLTGVFTDQTMTFDNVTLNNTGPLYTYDIYLVKVDSNGDIVWSKSIGGDYLEHPMSISSDKNGNVFITGNFSGSNMYFDNITLTNTTNDSLYDMFIARFDSVGNVSWAKGIGTTTDESGSNVLADDLGNVYVTGNYRNMPITFGTTTLSTSIYMCNSAFFVKYDDAGNVIFAHGFPNSNNNIGKLLCKDNNGNIYLALTFYSSIQLPNASVSSYGGTNLLICKYDASGNIQSYALAGGQILEDIAGITTDNVGNIYLTGYSMSPLATFGSHVLTANTSACNVVYYFTSKLNMSPTSTVNNLFGENSITAFPNPNNGAFYINALSGSDMNVEIYNTTGKLMYNRKLSEEQIDLGDVRPGIYYVRIKSDGKVYSEKIVVE